MRSVRNLITNLLIFIINIVIGLWLPPYIIEKLGVAAYGLIPLATSISTYALIIAITINGSVARYLIIDITKNDFERANKTFNTSLVSLSLLFIVLLPSCIIIALNIEQLINIPTNLTEEAHYLFLFIFLSFTIATYTSLFNSSAYVKNRLDLINLTTFSNVAIKLLSIILLFSFVSISLKSFGLSHLIASTITLFIGIYIFKSQTPFLKINFRKFEKTILKELFSMGGWLLVSQIGALLFLQIDLFLINLFRGAEDAGIYSVLLPWNMLIRTFAAVLASVIAPVILKAYADNRVTDIIKISSISVKYLGVLIAAIVGLLALYSKEILVLWVGEEYGEINMLFIILISHLGINLSVLPLYSVTNAYKKVKIPGIVTISLGLCNLLLSIFFLNYTHLGLYGIAISGLIVLTLKNVAFAAPYTAFVLGLKLTYFVKKMIFSLITLLITVVLGLLFRYYILIPINWIELIISMTLIMLGTLIFVYLFIIDKQEKLIIFETLNKYKSKIH